MPRSGIGELTVLADLGAGAGSRVFRVRRHADSAEYALKVVSAARASGGRSLDQLRHEFRVGRMLDHPNLVKVHAFELPRDWLFRPTTGRLLAEYAPGQPLDRLALSTGAALLAFAQIAGALQHMHERGVFHADLKPRNVICGPDGVKVIDYGLVWLEGEPKSRVQGTPEYMAPETAAYKVVNASTDIYNLGATMYYILTRRTLPAPALGVKLTARAHATRVAPVASLNPRIPRKLCELVHQCIHFDPGSRPGQAGAVRAALECLARAD